MPALCIPGTQGTMFPGKVVPGNCRNKEGDRKQGGKEKKQREPAEEQEKSWFFKEGSLNECQEGGGTLPRVLNNRYCSHPPFQTT
jgi:hypothetical protein